MSTITWPILSVLMWLPIAGGVAMILLGDKQIYIAFAGQTSVNPVAAFPVEIDDVISIEVADKTFVTDFDKVSLEASVPIQ